MTLQHRVRILLVLFLGFSSICRAGDIPEYPFITAEGSAETQVAPDKAIIYFEVTVFDKDSQEVGNRFESLSARILNDLTSAGGKSISIKGSPPEKMLSQNGDYKLKAEIVGYTIKQKVELTITDIEKYAQVIRVLYSIDGIDSINASFGISTIDTLKKALSIDACKNATENANRIAEGFGVKIKKVRGVSPSGFTRMKTEFGFDGDYSTRYGSPQPVRNNLTKAPDFIKVSTHLYAIFEFE